MPIGFAIILAFGAYAVAAVDIDIVAEPIAYFPSTSTSTAASTSQQAPSANPERLDMNSPNATYHQGNHEFVQNSSDYQGHGVQKSSNYSGNDVPKSYDVPKSSVYQKGDMQGFPGYQAPNIQGFSGYQSPNIQGFSGYQAPNIQGFSGYQGPNIQGTSNYQGPNIQGTSNYQGPNIQGTSNYQGPNIQGTSNCQGSNIQGTSNYQGPNIRTSNYQGRRSLLSELLNDPDNQRFVIREMARILGVPRLISGLLEKNIPEIPRTAISRMPEISGKVKESFKRALSKEVLRNALHKLWSRNRNEAVAATVAP